MSEIERKYQELIEFIKQNKEVIENERNTYREGMGDINKSDLNQRNDGLKNVFDSQSNIYQIEEEINNKIAEFISEFGELTDLGIQNIEEYYLNADNVIDARRKANNREETYQRYGGEKAKANLDKARQKLDDFEKNFEKSGDFTQLEENVESYRAILEKIKNDEEMQGLIKGEELSKIQDKIETIERFVAREKEDLNKNEEENSLTEEEKRVIENNLKAVQEKLKGVKSKALKKPNDPLYKKRIEAYQKQIEGYKELLGDYNKEQEDNTKYEIITTQRDEEKDNNQLKAKKLETELANLKTTLAQYEKNGGASPEDIAKLRAVIKRKEGDLNKILGKNDISENLNDDNSVLKIEDKQFKLNKEINDLQEKYKQYQENGQLSPEELDKIKKAIHDKAEELKGIKQLESGDDENKNQYLYKEKEIDSDMYLRNFQEEINALKSDMIDKFYGNSEKEKLYNSAMKRLKEHEVKENINGKEYIVKVDEYPEKESDMKFLQLELYEEKLQRLAKNALNPKAKVYSSDEEKAADEQYVKTRNFAYDRKKATTENLTTLGKYGEKYPYLSLQSDKDRGVVANNLIKAAKVATNGLILSRNAVATISRAIGKPISKVYKTIAPDKAAIYANKPTHRYEERKTYFMQEENKRLAEEGKSLRPFRTLMKSRIKAIVNYKEGNAAILESGYEDIKRSYIDKAKVQYYKSKLNDMDTYAEYLLNESRDLLKGRDPLLVNTSEMEKYEAIQEALEDLNNKKQQIIKNPKLNGIIDKNGHVKNKAIVQTDAISLKSHDKANKANVTRATTIAKAATIAGVKFTGPKIKDWMLQHCTTQKAQIVPGKTVKQWVPDLNEPSKVTNPADISKAMTNEEDLLEKLSIKNIMQNSQNGHASFAYGNSGKNITEDGLSYFRGAAQEINGNVVSISDANGFDITGVTSGTIDPSLLNNGNVSENVNIFDILANLQRKAGNDVTSKDLLNKVLSCKNTEEQTKVIEEMTKGLELWKSNSSQGMPVGWDDASDEISGALKGLQETIKQAVSESQATTRAFNYGEISGHFKDITTSDTINYVTTVNPRIVKALGIQGKIANGMSVVDAVRMTFENLRKTKSEKPQNKVPKTPREKLGFTGSSKKADQIVFAQKAQADSVKETIRREIEDEGR